MSNKSYNSTNTYNGEHSSLLRRKNPNKDGKLRTISTLSLALAIIMVSIVILIGYLESSKSCTDNSDDSFFSYDKSSNILAQLPPQTGFESIDDVSFSNNCTHFIYFDEINGEYKRTELSTHSALHPVTFVLSRAWAEHTIPIGASNLTFSICLKKVEPISFCKFYIYSGNNFQANADLQYTVKYKNYIESTIADDLPQNQIVFGTQDIITVGDCFTIRADFSQSGTNGMDTPLQYIQFNVSQYMGPQSNESEYRQFMNVKCETYTTESPTDYPTNEPTKRPTPRPTVKPTLEPSSFPTIPPTNYPSNGPTKRPSPRPTRPTTKPTPKPSPLPSIPPTNYPSNVPTERPTPKPTLKPTLKPSAFPTIEPTMKPTTGQPTHKPTPLCMACCPDIRFVHPKAKASSSPNVTLLMEGSYAIHELTELDYRRCGANGCDIEIKTTNCSKKKCSNRAYTISNDIIIVFMTVLFHIFF